MEIQIMKKTDINKKREQEKKMVTQMIQVYCRGKHHTKGKMCSECQVRICSAMWASSGTA